MDVLPDCPGGEGLPGLVGLFEIADGDELVLDDGEPLVVGSLDPGLVVRPGLDDVSVAEEIELPDGLEVFDGDCDLDGDGDCDGGTGCG